jgi:membrane associated rhomboid family serine protease
MKRFFWLAVLLGAIWAVEAVNLILGYRLNDWFGLRPRSVEGLDGVLFMPLLHGSLSHAVSNSFPLAVLGGIMTATARKVVLLASVVIIVLGGLGVWVFGATGVHIGASGLIFGWFGFLAARGLIEKHIVPFLAAAGIVLAYGSMIWGVLPGQPGVSWEAHFFCFAAGVLAAYVLRTRLAVVRSSEKV